MQAVPRQEGAGQPPWGRNATTRSFPPGRLTALAAVAVLLGILAHQIVANSRRDADALTQAGTRPTPRPIARAVPLRREEWHHRALERARLHLDRADAECRQALAEQLRSVDQFGADAKRRTPRFADQVLGWEGRWQVVTDRLRRGTGAHAAYVRRAFREIVFTPEQLEERARQAVAGYLDAVRDIEGVMLVALRRDLADLPTTLPLVTLDPRLIRTHFEHAVSRAAERAGTGLRDDVARELVAVVVGEALAQAAVRLGLSAGVLGTGAASSAATLGTGLVVGLIVDQALSWAWDPRRELVRDLDRRIDELRALVVDGTPEAPGLRRRWEHFDRERAARRRAAVLDLIPTAGGEP